MCLLGSQVTKVRKICGEGSDNWTHAATSSPPSLRSTIISVFLCVKTHTLDELEAFTLPRVGVNMFVQGYDPSPSCPLSFLKTTAHSCRESVKTERSQIVCIYFGFILEFVLVLCGFQNVFTGILDNSVSLQQEENCYF